MLEDSAFQKGQGCRRILPHRWEGMSGGKPCAAVGSVAAICRQCPVSHEVMLLINISPFDLQLMGQNLKKQNQSSVLSCSPPALDSSDGVSGQMRSWQALTPDSCF